MTARDADNDDVCQIDDAESCDVDIKSAIANMSTEDLSKIKMEEITLNNSNIARIGLEVDSFKNLNKPLCSMSKLFDRGYESYLSQGKIRKFKPPENFTGIFNPSNGDCIR